MDIVALLIAVVAFFFARKALHRVNELNARLAAFEATASHVRTAPSEAPGVAPRTEDIPVAPPRSRRGSMMMSGAMPKPARLHWSISNRRHPPPQHRM